MGTRDRRVDLFIAKSPAFAKPILEYIREAVHAGCPDCEETIKWGMPHFEYKGTLCGMAAFKHHASLIMWKASMVIQDGDGRTFRRVTSVSELPAKKTLIGYIKRAAALNQQGVKPPRKKAGPATPLRVPPMLAAALRKNTKARTQFEAFSPSRRNEYITWITEARTDATRAKRIGTAVEWMAEGKPRNWKYMRT